MLKSVRKISSNLLKVFANDASSYKIPFLNKTTSNDEINKKILK